MNGKVAIVTGGGTGVGRETSLALAKLDYQVIVVYSRSQAEAEQTVSEIGTNGGTALAIRADVANDADCRRMVQQRSTNSDASMYWSIRLVRRILSPSRIWKL